MIGNHRPCCRRTAGDKHHLFAIVPVIAWAAAIPLAAVSTVVSAIGVATFWAGESGPTVVATGAAIRTTYATTNVVAPGDLFHFFFGQHIFNATEFELFHN
jgi:hypothetical protein